MKKHALLSGVVAGATLILSASPVQAWTAEGVMKLSWAYRGGTCHVAYSEVGQPMGKYHTASDCDSGMMYVKGLTAGQKYQFQVSQDKHNWSRVVVGTAKAMMPATHTSAAAHSPQVAASQARYSADNGEAWVKLMWPHRGGTCYVRYTESNQKMYKYNTQESCDQGYVMIGKLVAGRSYRFQISQDGASWSKPVTAKAHNGSVMTGHMGYTHAAHHPVTTPVAAPAVGGREMSYSADNGNGSIRVHWPHRGGMCHVRYTESNQKAYKYSTVASCDDGSVEIKSLVAGRSYRVQVSQDGVNWSKPAVARAK